MIPTTNAFLSRDFTLTEQPSRTYNMDLEKERIRGKTEDLEAVKQSVFRILQTERYRHIMYSWDYGIELVDLYGQPAAYVCALLPQRISEALLWDSRVLDILDFEFDTSEKGSVHAFFTVRTIFGDFTAEKEVAV